MATGHCPLNWPLSFISEVEIKVEWSHWTTWYSPPILIILLQMCLQYTKQKDFETLYAPISNWRNAYFHVARYFCIKLAKTVQIYIEADSAFYTLLLPPFYFHSNSGLFLKRLFLWRLHVLFNEPAYTNRPTYISNKRLSHFTKSAFWNLYFTLRCEIDVCWSWLLIIIGWNIMVSIILLLLRGPSPQSESPFPDPESTTAHSLPPFTLAGHHSYLPTPHPPCLFSWGGGATSL